MQRALAIAGLALVAACQSSRNVPLGGDTPADAAAPGPPAAGADAAVGPPEPPLMQQLSVTPLTLTPAFSPSIHDYYVRCAAGANALSVTMEAASGATVALLQPTTTAPTPSQTDDVVVAEDQAVVISASESGTSTEYWVRCLPHDFPPLEMTPHPAAGTVVPGYYLVGGVFFASNDLGYAMLLDTHGTPVWYGVTSNEGGAKDVDFLEPNTISYVPIAGYTYGTYEGQWEMHSLAPVGVSYVTSVGLPVDTHELRRMANGDFLMFASPVVTGVNLTGLPQFGSNEDILNCVIQEVSPAGALVWQWNATDHFDIVKESTWTQTAPATNLAGQSVTVVDPFHCNSIDLDPSGNLLVSARHMDALFLISKATGKVVWKMGGAPYNKDGATLIHMTGDPLNGFYRQHDARFQPDGTITLFDDQTDMPGPARALVVSYDVGAGTASIVWQYKGKASVDAMGSFAILPDGSRVIGWGIEGGGNTTFTEVDENGDDLLDFYFPEGDTSYRALKIPTSTIDIETLRKSVGAWSSSLAATDAGAGPESGATQDGDEGGAASSGPVACYALSGSGSTQQCGYSSSTAPGFACASIPGAVAGTCPSSGLYGCCLQTSANGGDQAVTATCYYAASTGQEASSECNLEAYQGMPYRWQTTPP